MVFHETKMHREWQLTPTELDSMRIKVQRGLANGKDDLDKLRRLDVGEEGERKLIQKLEEFGKSHWVLIRNLRLKEFTTFESDLVLATSHCVYVIEVKNYTGKFEYNQGDSYFNGKELNSNIVQQIRNAYMNMKNICGKFSSKIPVKGILVFIGENNQVTIQSEVKNISILTLTDLYDFIKNIAREEQQSPFPQINVGKLIAHLEKFETPNNYLPIPLSAEQLQNAKRGIHCSRCLRYDVKIKRNYVECACGLHEPREEAVVRTICEYGVLTYDRDFTKGDLMKFIGEDISLDSLQRILAKHFKQMLNGRYTTYLNLKLPYYKIVHLFLITKPVKFYTERGNPDVYLMN